MKEIWMQAYEQALSNGHDADQAAIWADMVVAERRADEIDHAEYLLEDR